MCVCAALEVVADGRRYESFFKIKKCAERGETISLLFSGTPVIIIITVVILHVTTIIIPHL